MSRPQAGPPLIAPGLAIFALSIASVAVGARAPRPDAPAAEVLRYAQEHAGAMRWSGFLLLAVSVPLAIWTATVYRRLRALGVTAPGSAIALAGGLLAAVMAALSGLVTWTASRVDDSAPLAAALRDLSFAAGGPAFVVFFGLLVAGIAVPLLLLRITSRLASSGL